MCQNVDVIVHVIEVDDVLRIVRTLNKKVFERFSLITHNSMMKQEKCYKMLINKR